MVQIKWEMGRFHNVIDLPEEYEVRDLTTGVYRPSKSEYDVGKYDENRPMVYNTDLFQGTRTLHVGIDSVRQSTLPACHSKRARLPTSATIHQKVITDMLS